MEPESPNTHAPECQTGCGLACSTDTPDGARTHRLCDLAGLFFLLFARHLRIGPRRLFCPRPQLSVVETLSLTDTLTRLTDTPLCPTSPGLIYPRLHRYGGCELGPVARWSSPAWTLPGCLVRGTTMLDRIQSPSHDKAGAGQSSSFLPRLIHNPT